MVRNRLIKLGFTIDFYSIYVQSKDNMTEKRRGLKNILRLKCKCSNLLKDKVGEFVPYLSS
jgi:hypothetical protein